MNSSTRRTTPRFFDGIEADTLRDRFVVTLEDNSLITQTKEMLKQIDGVDEVSAHDEIANGFQTVQKVLNIAAMVIIVVLFVVSMFIISNTIKLRHVLAQPGNCDHEDGRRDEQLYPASLRG